MHKKDQWGRKNSNIKVRRSGGTSFMQETLSYNLLLIDSGSSNLEHNFSRRNHKIKHCKYFQDIKEMTKSNNSLNYDAALLDFDSTAYSGWEVLSFLSIHEKTKDIPVIILTEMDDENTEVQALNNGAKDFICKPYSFKKLLARIEANKRSCNSVINIDLDLPEVSSERKQLTSRETEILSYIISGYTNKQIAEKTFITTLTAANHIKNILRKLNVQNRTQAVIVAIKSNLINVKN